MKTLVNPKCLKPLFDWEHRRVLIQDRVWYFPDRFNDPYFQFPGWDSALLFGNDHPIAIEYCSGNGLWIVEKAKAEPWRNWVAVERQYERVRKIWSKIQNEDLLNLIVVCGEGVSWTEKYVPDNTVEAIFVNFPDPWPKARHAKHRIVSPKFKQQAARVLQPGGTVTLVTDDVLYSDTMIEVFTGPGQWSSLNADPYYVERLEGYGSSFFDNLWREKGRTIRYHQFQRSAP